MASIRSETTSPTTTTIYGSAEVPTATVTVTRRRIPLETDNGDGTGQPRFLLFFHFHRHHLLRFTGDNEADYPSYDCNGVIMELPMRVLGGTISCATYLWNRLPFLHEIFDGTSVNFIVHSIGFRVCNIARTTNFSGFQLDAIVETLSSETVAVTTEYEGASESALEKLTAESFYANGGETGLHENCVICLDEFSGDQLLTKMPCSHVFHQSCVVEWLGRSNSCPLCRTKVDDD